MNSLIRFDPFRELDVLHSRFNTLFRGTPSAGQDDSSPLWAPLVDISEDEKHYVIKVELPEVKKEDVKVTVENDVLTITGERKAELEDKSRRYHRVERAYGRFIRTFALPDDADTAKIGAHYKDGVLRVELTKQESAKPRNVDVKVD